jgi:hypothetical protein
MADRKRHRQSVALKASSSVGRKAGNECSPQFETERGTATKLEVRNRTLLQNLRRNTTSGLAISTEQRKSHSFNRRGDVHRRDDNVLAMAEYISALRSTWAATVQKRGFRKARD